MSHQKPLSSLWMWTPLPNSIELAGTRYGPNCCDHSKLDTSGYDRRSAMVDKVMNLKKQVKISSLASMWSCKMPTSQWLKPWNTLVMPTTQKWRCQCQWCDSECSRALVWCGRNPYQEVLAGVVRKESLNRYAWKWCSNVGCLLGNTQLTCVEFARHVSGLEGANSAQGTCTKYKIPLSLISCWQVDVEDIGGTLRLTLSI